MNDALTRLEGYLRLDPHNARLLTEVFETALRHGRADRAQAVLEQLPDALRHTGVWRLRQAHAWMVQDLWPQAQELLHDLRAEAEVDPVVLHHDLAYCAWHLGQLQTALEWLAPWRGPSAELPTMPELQTLLLRLLHRTDALDEALNLARHWEQQGRWVPDVAGVASLLAFDQAELALAHRWSLQALEQHPQHLEALITQASLALSQQQGEQVQTLLRPLLEIHPQEGRAQSLWAFADMQAGRLESAGEHFELALQTMPDHVGTWIGSGWVCLLCKQHAAALQRFEQALALDRNFADSHGSCAAALAWLGQRELAEQAIHRALRLSRRCASAHYAQAVLDGHGEDPDFLSQLAQALMTEPAPNRAARLN